MPDTRSHRGPAPEDARLFARPMWPRLRQATRDLGWLLDHGYALNSAAELVGNRHTLTTRQRQAVTLPQAWIVDLAPDAATAPAPSP